MPRRALMLTPDEGHLDRRIAQEAASLATVGWSVDIYPAVDPGLRFEGDLAAGVRLLASPQPPRRISTRRRLLRVVKRRLARVVPHVDRLIEFVRYRRGDLVGAIAARNVDHLLSLPAYDLVVAHDVPVFRLATRLKAAWACPLICDLHEVFPEQDEYFTTETARSYWRTAEARGLADADGVIFVNAAVGDYVRRTHGSPAHSVVIHNAVPYVDQEQLRGTSLRDYYPIPAGDRIMLFAGSLRPHKQLEVLIDGFGRAGLDGWVLAILGEGPLRETLERQVARNGLTGRVFLGRHAPQRDLVTVTASADLGLLPYQEVGFNYLIATPNKLFEYIQARLPIATSRLPMIERIVNTHGTGGFVDFSTAASTADGLRAFVTGPLNEITPARLEVAARTFAWEQEETELFKLVTTVMPPREA